MTDLTIRMKKPPGEAVVATAGLPDCPVPYCLVRWVGPWVLTNAGPLSGSVSLEITQRIVDEEVPNDPDPPIIIPGGSNNCRIPLVWVLWITFVESSCSVAAWESDFQIIESDTSIAQLRQGWWTLVSNGAHTVAGCSAINVELHAQAYLEDKHFPNGSPVPFGDEIVWGIA